jgi:hypothetical protein
MDGIARETRTELERPPPRMPMVIDRQIGWLFVRLSDRLIQIKAFLPKACSKYTYEVSITRLKK